MSNNAEPDHNSLADSIHVNVADAEIRIATRGDLDCITGTIQSSRSPCTSEWYVANPNLTVWGVSTS